MSTTDRERLFDLLADEATGELDAAGRAELERLLAAAPEVDAGAFHRAAAAVQVTTLDDPLDELPDSLKRRIESDAADFFRGRSAGTGPRSQPDGGAPGPDGGDPLWASPWPGWLAAAAAVLLAFLVWQRAERPQDAEARRGALLASAEGAIELAWTATEDELARGAGGDVVWSGAEQAGYMRFRGLAPNDPTRNQYQLWIFDAERPEATPVDGGVFDVPAGADEVVVPIDAKLRVARPTLFAVTLERPGGVVVSDRERLVLVAPVP